MKDMKKFQTIAIVLGIALTGTTAFTACSSNDLDEERVVYDDNGKAGVKSEFVISIPRKVVSVTRQSDIVAQASGSVGLFRGLGNIRLIPFGSVPADGSSKLADIIKLSPVYALDQAGTDNYKVYSDQFVPVGTTNFLFYGRALTEDEADSQSTSPNQESTEVSSMDDKFKYGILKVRGLSDADFTTPSAITFSLEQINASDKAQADDPTGKAIVELLTTIANTTSSADAPHDKWSTTNNIVLATLYKKFTGITTSSSHTLSVILSKVYNACLLIPSTSDAYKLALAIKANIMTGCTKEPELDKPASLSSTYEGYPGNLGLPDGAVRVRWNGSAFEDVSAHYGKGYELKLTDYCYPAALWYYTSSPLKAAAEEKASKYKSASDWDNVINSVYSGASDIVQAGTQSVALVNAAEYGVGRLETRIKMETGTYYDANGNEVEIGTTGYTLKGLLLGGQSSVGFDFTQKGSENRAIYDRVIDNQIVVKPGDTSVANQTLALETEKGKTIYAVLELINNGADFMGADGVIPAKGTFYLAVMLNPKSDPNYADGTLDKIIQQDYVTQLTITIRKGSQVVDRNGDGNPDVYIIDTNTGLPIGVDKNGDGKVDENDNYDINGDGVDDTFISDPELGGPGWDINSDGKVDIPLLPNDEGNYPKSPSIPEGLGCATNGIPDITSPGVELGTSVNLEWKEGLVLTPEI